MSVFLRDPLRFLQVVKTVRRSMAARSELVRLLPQRLRKFRMQFPIYVDGPYRPWQIDAAFALLTALGDGAVPLDYRRYGVAAALAELPFARLLRDRERLHSIATFTEYQVDWPERLAIDLLLAMERAGGVALNYTGVSGFEVQGKDWLVRLQRADTGETAQIRAKALLDFAGPWIGSMPREAAKCGARSIAPRGLTLLSGCPRNSETAAS